MTSFVFRRLSSDVRLHRCFPRFGTLSIPGVGAPPAAGRQPPGGTQAANPLTLRSHSSRRLSAIIACIPSSPRLMSGSELCLQNAKGHSILAIFILRDQSGRAWGGPAWRRRTECADKEQRLARPRSQGGAGGRARPGRPRPLLGHAGAGPAQAARDGGPPDKGQRNFTDPDSRIQPTRDGFIAGYNGEIAVDAAHQIIVAQRLQTNPADYAALVPLVDQAKADLGRKIREVSGDCGLATAANLEAWPAAVSEPIWRPGEPSTASAKPPTTSASRTFPG